MRAIGLSVYYLTLPSKVSRIENRVSRLENRDASNCQLTFERYCKYIQQATNGMKDSKKVQERQSSAWTCPTNATTSNLIDNQVDCWKHISHMHPKHK